MGRDGSPHKENIMTMGIYIGYNMNYYQKLCFVTSSGGHKYWVEFFNKAVGCIREVDIILIEIGEQA